MLPCQYASWSGRRGSVVILLLALLVHLTDAFLPIQQQGSGGGYIHSNNRRHEDKKDRDISARTGQVRRWSSPATIDASSSSSPSSSSPSSSPPSHGTLPTASKESLFAALDAPGTRKEAFEQLWNSEYVYTVDEYQELLKTCCRLGYVRPFQDLISEMMGMGVSILPNTWTSCVYIAKSRDFFRLGIACLEKMVETGLRPDHKAVNQVMTSCEKKGRWQEALGLFDFLGQSGMELPPLTYWMLASLLSREGRWDEFMRVEADLRARSDFPEGIRERFYSTAVVSRSGCQDWRGSLDMVRQMHESGVVPSLKGFTTALSTCMAAGAYKELRDFVEEARGWPDMHLDLAIYNIVINSYSREKDLEGADRWFQRLLDEGLRPSLITYGTLFRVCLASRQGSAALKYYKRMVEVDDLQPNLTTVSYALQALLSSPSQVPEAKMLLHEAKSLLEETTNRWGVVPNCTCYNPVIKAAGESGNSTMVYELYTRLKTVDMLDPEPRTIWEAVVAMCKCQDYTAIPQMAEDIMSSTKSQYSRKDLSYTYHSLFMALERAGNTVERAGNASLAIRLWEHMMENNIPADVNLVAMRLLGTLVKAKRYEQAVSLYQELEVMDPAISMNINVTNSVLAAMVAVTPSEALDFFHALREKGQVDDRSYCSVVEACDKLGDVQQLQALWSETRAKGIVMDRVSYGLLLRALGNAGQVDDAMEGLRLCEEVGVGWNNYTIALAVIGCKRLRQWGPALSMVRELRAERGLTLNVVVYNSLLTVCEAGGQWRACLRILDEMEEVGVEPDYASLRITLNALATAYRMQEIITLYEKHANTVFQRLGSFTFRVVVGAYIRCDPRKALPLIKIRQAVIEPTKIDRRIYKSLLVSLGFRQDAETALEVLSMIPRAQRDISLICATASVLVRNEETRVHAVTLLKTAEAEGLSFDSVAYSLGVQAAYLAGDFDMAAYYLNSLNANHLRHGNVSVNFGVSLLARQGRWQDMRVLMDKLVSTVEAEEGWAYVASRQTVDVVAAAVAKDEAAEAIKASVITQLQAWLEVPGPGRGPGNNKKSRKEALVSARSGGNSSSSSSGSRWGGESSDSDSGSFPTRGPRGGGRRR